MEKSITKKGLYQNILLILIIHMLFWIIVSWATKPSLDSYGDMIENYAWSQTWEWGSFKHPPFFAWVVKIWFIIFPKNNFFYFLLSYVNAAIGLLSIVLLAQYFKPRTENSYINTNKYYLIILIFALLSMPYSNLAGKFNADTILLSLWPLTAYAFFTAVSATDNYRRLKWSIILGVLAACSILGKYFSGVLLLTLFIIALTSKQYRYWFLSRYPYISFVVMCALLLPHLIWEINMSFPFQEYLSGKIEDKINIKKIITFLLSGIFYLLLSWILWIWLRYRNRRQNPSTKKAYISLELALICTLPVLIVIAFHVFGHVHLTTHWAIPIWFALPILMGNLLWSRLENINTQNYFRNMVLFWIILGFLSIAYTAYLSISGNKKFTLARPEQALAISTAFQKQFPNQQLGWIGGVWPESAGLSFYSDKKIFSLPGEPNRMPALVNPHIQWVNEYGAILCVNQSAYASATEDDNIECINKTKKWLKSNNINILEDKIYYQSEGWQFVNTPKRKAVIFWIPPNQK